jgi:hypothetical protein
MDLTTQTPAEIDTALAAIYEEIYDAQHKAGQIERDIKHYRNAIAQGRTYISQDDVDRQEARLDEVKAEILRLYRSCAPYNEEFDRRGGWTRAWLVDNQGGHVHRSMDCSTCFPTTRFGWLPQVSGLDEDEIVAQAGERACTVCYPSAPAEVLNNPSALELPKRREERLAREAEAAKRNEAKVAKSLSLDGSVVKVRWDHETEVWNSWKNTMDVRHEKGWKELKTYRAAELFVVEALSGVGYDHPSQDVIDHVLELMAAKKGVSVEEIREPLAAKAAKKRAKG